MESLVSLGWRIRRGTRGEGDGYADYLPPPCWSAITASALALHCCKAQSKIKRKIENSTPCIIATHEDFNFKQLGTRDYVVDITHHATFGSNRSSGGFPPNRGNITLLWLFCYPVLFFSILRPGRTDAQILTLNSSMTCFCPRTVLLWVRMMSHMGKICPKNFLKRGVNRQFQAKTPKSINHNISRTINPTN